MGICSVCANESARTFDVMYEGGILTFDSFQCAIHRLAPICNHCDCAIIGHVVESEAAIYCCLQCAHRAQEKNIERGTGDARAA
jgi:Zn finger protein HypA/HybF involved in hydrogenase expression